MYKEFVKSVKDAKHVLILQAENPDGDSLASALALEELLGEQGLKTTLYCAVDIPKYLRYMQGWDRVDKEWPRSADLVIIVDTASEALMEKALTPAHTAHLKKVPVYVFDHHPTESSFSFEFTPLFDVSAIATCEVIGTMAEELKWKVSPNTATLLASGMLADSLGLTTPNVRAVSVRRLAWLVDNGASLNAIENARREYMRKSPEILAYKGTLLQRVEYHLDGRLALVHIPWEEIEAYSDQYNPSVLVLDEMRLVEGVLVAIAIKTYPDSKLTGKIRANTGSPVAEEVAGYFGGGGHAYSAGFKVYDEHYETLKGELLNAVHKALEKRVSPNAAA